MLVHIEVNYFVVVLIPPCCLINEHCFSRFASQLFSGKDIRESFRSFSRANVHSLGPWSGFSRHFLRERAPSWTLERLKVRRIHTKGFMCAPAQPEGQTDAQEKVLNALSTVLTCGKKFADAQEGGASAMRTEAPQPLEYEERLLQRALRGAPGSGSPRARCCPGWAYERTGLL